MPPDLVNIIPVAVGFVVHLLEPVSLYHPHVLDVRHAEVRITQHAEYVFLLRRQMLHQDETQRVGFFAGTDFFLCFMQRIERLQFQCVFFKRVHESSLRKGKMLFTNVTRDGVSELLTSRTDVSSITCPLIDT
ncbi:hypothetical protein EBZ80_21545 [bacterium]|nr:hypothetical protein [bacterium]